MVRIPNTLIWHSMIVWGCLSSFLAIFIFLGSCAPVQPLFTLPDNWDLPKSSKNMKIRQNTCFWHQNTSVFGIFRCEKAVSRPFLGRFWWFFRFFPSKKHIGTVSSSLQAFSTTYMVSKVMCDDDVFFFAAKKRKIFHSFFENLKNLKANFTMRKKSKKFFFCSKW